MRNILYGMSRDTCDPLWCSCFQARIIFILRWFSIPKLIQLIPINCVQCTISHRCLLTLLIIPFRVLLVKVSSHSFLECKNCCKLETQNIMNFFPPFLYPIHLYIGYYLLRHILHNCTCVSPIHVHLRNYVPNTFHIVGLKIVENCSKSNFQPTKRF